MLFLGYLKWEVLGAWMTFKKAEMAKTLKNGLIMIETNPLNHNWSHFVILSGLTLHQFQKKLLLSTYVIVCKTYSEIDLTFAGYFSRQGTIRNPKKASTYLLRLFGNEDHHLGKPTHTFLTQRRLAHLPISKQTLFSPRLSCLSV